MATELVSQLNNDYDNYVYETELKDFLPPEFIDCHVHVYAHDTGLVKPATAQRVYWTGKVSRELTGAQLVATYKDKFPQNKVTPLIFGACGKNRDVNVCNDYVKTVADEYDMPTLFRTSYDMSADSLEEQVIKGGFLGLKPYLTFSPDYIPREEIRIYDFLPKEHLEVANKHGWIVMLHIARDKRLKDPVNIAQLLEIEEKYPNVKLVVAHIGRAYAKEDIGDAFDFLKNTKNMMFDFTANVCDDAIKACIEAVGPERLMFGSDLPIAFMRMYRIVENGEYINVVPRGLYGDLTGVPRMRETDETDVTTMIYEQIRALKRVALELKLTDKEVEDIMFTNAKKMIEAAK